MCSYNSNFDALPNLDSVYGKAPTSNTPPKSCKYWAVRCNYAIVIYIPTKLLSEAFPGPYFFVFGHIHTE